MLMRNIAFRPIRAASLFTPSYDYACANSCCSAGQLAPARRTPLMLEANVGQ